MQRRLVLVLTAAALLSGGCGAAGGAESGRTAPAVHQESPPNADTSPSTGLRASSASRRLHKPTKVLVVIEENHSYRQMRDQMPYLSALATKYGYATNWKAFVHPSEPNYLAIVGGSMFGVTNDGPPSENAAKVGRAGTVFGQALRAGKSAATYSESVPGNCALASHGDYAVRHNPWTYFRAERAACAKYDVGTQKFATRARANKLPNVGFLIPNLAHDAHDASLSKADVWLRASLAPVLQSRDFNTGRLVVIVTADEDDGNAGNVVLTAVLTPHVHHKVVKKRLDHYSLTRFIAKVLHVRPLGNGKTAPDMAIAFGLR